MKVWSCTMDGSSLSPTLLGIFSSKEKAEAQARVFMQGVGDLSVQVDKSVTNWNEILYYQTLNTDEVYNALIEEFEIDDLSY